ncbi:MAG: hypothetical protein RL233_1901 [Bacteroidota bacterium]
MFLKFKFVNSNNIKFKSFLVFALSVLILGEVGAQGICYPFIKRQYFTNTDKVGLSNMTTTSVSV